MQWGEAMALPPDTDGGLVEADMVAVSYLSSIACDSRPELGVAEKGLDGFFADRLR